MQPNYCLSGDNVFFGYLRVSLAHLWSRSDTPGAKPLHLYFPLQRCQTTSEVEQVTIVDRVILTWSKHWFCCLTWCVDRYKMTKRKRTNTAVKVQDTKKEEPTPLPLVRQSDEPVAKKVSEDTQVGIIVRLFYFANCDSGEMDQQTKSDGILS